MRRKDFLIGLGGTAMGVTLGAGSARYSWPPDCAASPTPTNGVVSYAQAGEDLVVDFFLRHFNITDVTYLDIGAFDPIYINNTYFFYKRGHRGVLIEPNVDRTPKLRSVRPRDTVLEAGIGIGKPGMADYYVMSEPSWSTFDKREVEHQERVTRGKIRLKEVRRMPLLDVNEVIAKHFGNRAPTFVSIDAEGWHLPILKSIDYRRFRPPIICVETRIPGESGTIQEIPQFMATVGYGDRGGSFVNTIFVDSKVL